LSSSDNPEWWTLVRNKNGLSDEKLSSLGDNVRNAFVANVVIVGRRVIEPEASETGQIATGAVIGTSRTRILDLN